jgi:hypothetical protein
MSPAQVRDIGVRISDALAAAHAAGVLHRDIKPANILVNRYGLVGLSDFGLAAIMAAEGGQSTSRDALTPAYASPETFRGEEPTAAADIYSLAATLYALLAGRPPRFPAGPGEPGIATIIALHDQPVDDVPGTPPGLMAILRHGLAANPAARPPSAAAFRDALASLPVHPGISAQPGMSAQPGGSVVPGRLARAARQPAPLTPAPSTPHVRPSHSPPPAHPAYSAPPANSTAPDHPLYSARPAPSTPPAAPVSSPYPMPSARPAPAGTEPGMPPGLGLGGGPGSTAPPVPARRRRRPVTLLAAAAGVALLVAAAAVVGARVLSPGASTGAPAAPASTGTSPIAAPPAGLGTPTVTSGCPAASVPGAGARCPRDPECWAGPVISAGSASARSLLCSRPHVWQTFAIAVLPAGVRTFDGNRVAANPTVSAVCSMRVLLASRRGAALGVPAGSWRITVLPPDEAAFDSGARAYRCLAHQSSGADPSTSQFGPQADRRGRGGHSGGRAGQRQERVIRKVQDCDSAGFQFSLR